MKPVLLSPVILELSIAFMLPTSRSCDFSQLLMNLASVLSEAKQLTPNYPSIHRWDRAQSPRRDREIENA